MILLALPLEGRVTRIHDESAPPGATSVVGTSLEVSAAAGISPSYRLDQDSQYRPLAVASLDALCSAAACQSAVG